VEITIDVDERRPLAGRVWVRGGAPAGFAGWLALLALLERLVEEDGLASAADGLGRELDARGEAKLAQRAGDVGPDRAAG
jgi:hypothetical protein